MKTFYIPTSSLNFNNILSSESISPKAFYEKRGFGYSRWNKIPENPFDNAIVLYDKMCYFERPKSDVEDHSLLVEVLLDETELKQTGNIWYSDHTIYLAPTTTRFLFFSDNEKKISLSMTEYSLDVKVMRLYKNKISSISKPNDTYQSILTNEPCALNISEINSDFRSNKMKGLLYGYYIGALLSSDLDSVNYLNTQKEIHNIFAAILSSFNKQPTPHQNERLDMLFHELNRRNSDYQLLLDIIGDGNKADKVLELDFVKPQGFVKKTDFLFLLQKEQNEADKENPSIAWIRSKIENTKHSIMQKAHLLQPDKSEIVVLNNSVSVVENENVSKEIDKKLCLAWFNETLSSKEINGKISTYRAKLADDITDEAIKVLGDKWKESKIRTYLNALRHHVAGESFEQDWNNGILASMAAVIIAGDDWEKLLAFMQNKEMTDYRLAFAIYGELNGYANLTRDYTDLLYNQKAEYVRDVYKEFYGQLYRKRLPTTNGTSILKQNGIVQTTTENSLLQSVQTEKKQAKNTTSQNIIGTSKTDVLYDVNQKLNSLKWWNNKGTKRDQILRLFEQYGSTEQFINEVSKLQGVGEKKILELKNIFNINNNLENNTHINRSIITEKDSKEYTTETKFILPLEKLDSLIGNGQDLFIFDRTLISDIIKQKYPTETNFILSLESLKDLPNKAIERLIDTFGYTAKEKDKNEHLKFFFSLCINEGRGYKNDKSVVKNQGLFGIYTNELNEKVKAEIETRYNEYR